MMRHDLTVVRWLVTYQMSCPFMVMPDRNQAVSTQSEVVSHAKSCFRQYKAHVQYWQDASCDAGTAPGGMYLGQAYHGWPETIQHIW